jgi:amino acid transporter
VSQITGAEFVYETTASAVQEKKKLRRNFRRFDMFFYLICTVVTLDTIGAVAANGAQGFTWLIFLGIFFFLPYGLSIAELGSAFPQEGGPYVWSRLAFGRKVAAINSVIYWISNPIWVGGSLTIVSFAAIEEFFGNVPGGWKYVYAVAFIWFTITAAIVSLQYGKWVPTLGRSDFLGAAGDRRADLAWVRRQLVRRGREPKRQPRRAQLLPRAAGV